MIDNLEFYSAKTYHDSNVPDAPIQGTGTIIASQGKYFLVTALHCMRFIDDDGVEIVSPDWRKMRAVIYMPKGEVDIVFKEFVDADDSEDWAILEIEKPNNSFDYQHGLILSNDYTMEETFGAYGFPRHIADGIYLEFLPTNLRGENWRLKDIVQGGSAKAITAEKGCSGMGLFHVVDGVYHCLGIINKSVPGGDFNAMKLVSFKAMAKFFPDIYQRSSELVAKPSDEDLEKLIEVEKPVAYVDISDNVLSDAFMGYMELAEYGKAYEVINQLWERYPYDEWTTLNMIKVASLVSPHVLDKLQVVGLNLAYSTPQGVVFAARSFANNGFPQTAVDIWYNNALKFNDNELDTLFYVEMLESPMRDIVYKEYETVIEGKNVLYDDGKGHRHCLIASDKTLMARTMLGKKKGEEFILNIAGEDRKVKIIAIHDKYYSIIHRALTDVMEQGGNKIMKPIKVNENMTSDEVLKMIFETAGMDTTMNAVDKLQNDYFEKPSFLLNNNADDMLWRYYRFLFTDFKLKPRPECLKDPKRFCYITPNTRFVLDLSSLIILFEKTMDGVYAPTKKLIISNFLYEYIRAYTKQTKWQNSYDMHKVYEAGKICRFSEKNLEDVRMRYVALLKWMDDYCERLSSSKVLELSRTQEETESTLLFKHTMTLLMDDPSRALLTEDWYYSELLKMNLLMFDSAEFMCMP